MFSSASPPTASLGLEPTPPLFPPPGLGLELPTPPGELALASPMPTPVAPLIPSPAGEAAFPERRFPALIAEMCARGYVCVCLKTLNDVILTPPFPEVAAATD